MGWCSSGTDIFDKVTRFVLESKTLTEDDKGALLRVLIMALYDADWDCESDSRYFKHPLVRKIMKQLNREMR